MKPRLLWASDGCVDTGFARVSHTVLGLLQEQFDVAMLGAHYTGNPHRYPYEIWPGVGYVEPFGYAKLEEVAASFKPDVVLVLNDAYYVAKFQKLREKLKGQWKLVGYMPMDGPNLAKAIGEVLSDLDLAIFYTHFGMRVATEGGFRGFAAVIPHGIDRGMFYPRPLLEARQAARLDHMPGWRDAFIIGNVNRNQPRKRLDLTIAYFADWCRREKLPDNVKLYLHCAQKDVHIADVAELAKYFGIGGRMILPGGEVRWDKGLGDAQLAAVYSSLDLQVSTTLGEGWGLTTMEGMACGVPQLVPRWAALDEWPRGAVEYVQCGELEVFTGLENRIGAVADRESFISGLDGLYRSEERRSELIDAGLDLVRRPEFEWPTIAQTFANMLHAVIDGTLGEEEPAA